MPIFITDHLISTLNLQNLEAYTDIAGLHGYFLMQREDKSGNKA
jgi:hypothetical protein